jgi:biopolymer transport protein ExbD
MKYMLEVCLVAFIAGTLAPSLTAQSPALQKGISVKLAPARTASPMPRADSGDAFIVAVTASGSVYLGVNPITLPELTERARSTPFRRNQAVYIKADARTAYRNVLPVLEATCIGIVPQILLTSQPESTGSSSIIPPEGLAVSVGSAFPPGNIATVVELQPSGQQLPLLKINNDEISWSQLESTLRRHFEKGDDNVVLLRADGSLPFADIVRAIDRCRASGARVDLAESEL